MIYPLFTVSWSGCPLQPTRLQHLCSQDIEAVASSGTLGQFDYSIETLSVPGSVAVGKVVKNGVPIVFDGQREGQEGINYVRCDLCEPCKVALQSVFFCRCFINAVKGFFEVVSDFQTWEVLEPRFKDQDFMLVQIIRASEQQKSIMHQGFALFVCQTFSYLLANSFQTSRKQFKDVELVYHQFAMRQDLMNGVMVAGPHIRTHDGDMLFRGIRQPLQVGNNCWLVSISKQVNDLMVFYVCDDASVLVKQIQFVNSDTGAFEGCYCVQTLYGLPKDETNKLFVNPHIIRDTGKCFSQGFLSDVKHQALCHEVVLIHIVQWFKKRSVAIPTSIALSYHLDTCSLASNWDIHEELMLDLVAIESRTGAMRATQSNRFLFGGDLVVMLMFFNRQNTPMSPAKNIQGQLSQFRLLPKEFYTRRVKAVASEGRVSQVHSTHFSDFSMVFTVVCFHVVFRIAEYRKQIPLYVCSHVYSALAVMQAKNGQQSSDALQLAGKYAFADQGYSLFVDDPTYSLVINEVEALSHHGHYGAAHDSLSQLIDTSTFSPKRALSERGYIRVLSNALTVSLKVKDKNLEQSAHLWKVTMQRAQAFKSERRFEEAMFSYHLMDALWSGDKRIHELRDLAIHW